MNSIGSVYTEVNDYGLFPLRTVVPVPEGFNGSLKFKDYPSQNEVCLIRDDGSPASIEVIAMVDQKYQGFQVVVHDEEPYQPSPPVVHPLVRQLMLEEKILLCIEDDEGNIFKAELNFEFENPTENNRLRKFGLAEVVLETTGAFLNGTEHFGGFVAQLKTYQGLPGVVVDFSWHNAFVRSPLGRNSFVSMWMELPGPWNAVKVAGLRGWRSGEDRIYLIHPLPNKGLHTIWPQTRYDGRFVICPHGYETIAYDFAREDGHSIFFANDDWETDSITLEGVPVPDLNHISSLDERMESRFSKFFGALESGSPIDPSQSEIGKFGYRHGVSWEYGGVTGGVGIEHRPFSELFAVYDVRTIPYFREYGICLLDRSYGFMYEADGRPADVHSFPEPFNFVLSPNCAGWSDMTALWPSYSQDPFNHRGVSNDPPTEFSNEQGAYGQIDLAHFVRFSSTFKVMMERTNDPWCRRVIEDVAAMVLADHWNGEGDGYSARVSSLLKEARANPGHGSELSRADGWALEFMCLADACGVDMKPIIRDYVEIFSLSQLPTGFVQCSSSGKEFTGEDRYNMSYQDQILTWAMFCARKRVEVDESVLLKACLAFHRFTLVEGLNGPHYKTSVASHPEVIPYTTREEIMRRPKSGGVSTYQYGVVLGIAAILAPDDPEVKEAISTFCWGHQDPLEYLRGLGLSNLANHATLLSALA